MHRRLIPTLVLGLAGVALLATLGTWQVQRLAWKTDTIARIEARIGEAPVPVPPAPSEAADEFLPVVVTGALGGQAIRVLASFPGQGPGARVIAPIHAGDRAFMVDLGFVPETAPAPDLMVERVEVTGNLHWPDESDSWTPPPDAASGLWFARDVPAMARALGTEPVLIVARSVTPPLGTSPVPVGTEGIPNNHLGYAVTWFALALAWAAMSATLALRLYRRKD
ncbi:MAG: SURF1 family protein [Rubellimicrobium sp.]|nr:SURF1 family protein [Rubellimicrobium sp.]